MRNISDSLKTHLASEITTTAKCIKLTLKDSTIKGFTSLDQDIIFDGVTYKSSNLSDIKNLSDNLEPETSHQNIKLNLDSIEITETDIENGLYNNATIEIFMVNYRDVTQGKVIIKNGFIGEITKNGGEFTAEISNLSSKLNVATGAYYTPTCRARFGDSKCKINAALHTITTTVTQNLDDGKFLSTSLNQAAGYFNYGIVEFTSGANNGRKFEVADFENGIVKLSLKPIHAIASGDTFKITRGCDKNFSTCTNTYNNAINFHGEPHIPGTDTILKTAAN